MMFNQSKNHDMNFSELNLDITLAAFAEASDDDLKAWAEDVAPQGDLGVDYDTLDSYESESDLEDCYDYGGGCGSIMITFADGHWVDYTVDFHFSREVVHEIPYRTLLLMQKDKLRPCYGVKVERVSGKDMAMRRAATK